MELSTTLDTTLHVAGSFPEADASCKRALSDKYILAWIMHECVAEYKDIPANEIAEKYIAGQPKVASVPLYPNQTNTTLIQGSNTEDSSINEGTVYFDIVFYATVPETDDKIQLILNVEAQNKFSPGYPLISRGVYYASRLISSQYDRDFAHSEYDKIKKVYSIWVCPKPTEEYQNTVTKFSIREENLIGNAQYNPHTYDLLTVMMICLGDETTPNYEGIIQLLGMLMNKQMDSKEKIQILHDKYGIPKSEQLDKELETMCNWSQGVYAQGRAEGEARGRAEGEARGIIKMCKRINMNDTDIINTIAAELGCDRPQAENYFYEYTASQQATAPAEA